MVEINVSCEACHGPASLHVEMAKQAKQNGMPIATANHYGFSRDLSAAVKEWVYKEGHSTLQPKDIVTNQVQTCAQCHSRRTQLNEEADHVKGAFLDKYRLSLITLSSTITMAKFTMRTMSTARFAIGHGRKA